MTCKDCLHYEACKGTYQISCHKNFSKSGFDPDNCADFTDKSKWIHLPCKVGDTVYSTDFGLMYGVGEPIVPCEVKSIKSVLIHSVPQGYEGFLFYDHCVGKNIFLTKEEAEKALAERKEK